MRWRKPYFDGPELSVNHGPIHSRYYESWLLTLGTFKAVVHHGSAFVSVYMSLGVIVLFLYIRIDVDQRIACR